MGRQHHHVHVNTRAGSRLGCLHPENAAKVAEQAIVCSNVEGVEVTAPCVLDCTDLILLDRLAEEGCRHCGGFSLHFHGFGNAEVDVPIITCGGCEKVVVEIG